MKNIYAASLLDILPESILLDPKLRASAEALDAQFQAVTAATREVLHLPRLDELSGNILDYLAEQFHLDFYEPLYLTETEKKNLIRESIAWHRIKGTPAAVEKIAHDAFADAEILEWFEYGGEPYHFKIKSHGFKETPDGWATFVRMINTAKNVRSWCDNYELVLDEDIFGKNQAYVGLADLRVGGSEISIAKPRSSETKIFAGNSNLIYGNVAESLQRPKLKFAVPLYAGVANTKVGSIKIGTSTKPTDPAEYIAYSWTSKIFAATQDVLSGTKYWNLSLPRDQQANLFAGEVESKSGEVTIKPDTNLKISQKASLHVGQVLQRGGGVKIDTEDKPDGSNFYSHRWETQLYAGNANHHAGEITIKLNPVQRMSYKTVVRVGMVNTFAGYITIGCEDADGDDEFP